MANTGIKRPGSGRTKGSFSFVKISLADLRAKFADETTPIVVSRKWAEQVGFAGLTAAPAASTFDAIQGQTPDTKITAAVTDFDSQN